MSEENISDDELTALFGDDGAVNGGRGALMDQSVRLITQYHHVG